MPPIEPVVLTFGGGVNSRRRPADIDINECSAGENFDLDAQQLSMRTRKAFDLVSTADNALEIRGFMQLLKRDGTISTLVQAGGTVYSWDGDANPTTIVGTVNSNARLRGPREHNFTLDNLVIGTDLNKSEPVKTWDGTTFQTLDHNLTSTTFFAKFCRVYRERAIYGNVTTNTTDVPHLVVASQLDDATILSVSDRPSSSLGTGDPFFLITPDLRPINGMEFGFGQFLVSSDKGKLFAFTGSDSTDLAIEDFHEGSAISGDQAMVNIGNDVVMGLPGRIETLSGTLNFGDVETNDLSFLISIDVEEVTDWTIVYDRTSQQVFCFPDNQSASWVLHKSLVSSAPGPQQFSPWTKWTTTHSMDFQPSTVMQLVDPVSGKDVVYAGDTVGNIYRLNGSGQQDGGTDDVTVTRTSKLIRIDASADLFDAEVWIDYRLQFETDVTLTFLWGGLTHPTESVTFKIGGQSFAVYNGSAWYNGNFFYSHRFQTQIRRCESKPAGRGNYLQVKAEWTGEAEIEEIGIQLTAA